MRPRFRSHNTTEARDAGLERGRWVRSLEELARECAGRATTVSMLPARPAPDHEAHALPLRTIGYHARRDVLEVAVGGGPARRPALCYFITAPRRVARRDDEQGGVTLEVEDLDGARTVVRIAQVATADGPLRHAV
jgi:hypothetical protein